VCALPSTSNLGFSMKKGYFDYTLESSADINQQMRSLAGVPAGAQNAYLKRSRSTYTQAVGVAAAGPTITAQGNTAVTYPSGSLATRLKLAAKLLSAGLGTRIVTIHWGDFDTHGDQASRLDPQLSTLSRALGAFQADLTARGVEQKVVTLVFSEFGRRVSENDGGTDHGAGGLVMAMGSAVRGGLASPFPGCKPADLASGNLKVATDFRSVYQSVLGEWLQGDLTGVLDGTFPALDRFDGTHTLFG